MGRSTNQYLRLFQSLLPKGKVWNRVVGSNLTNLLRGQSEEVSRVDIRSDELLVQRDTRTATELLPDHERELGIPEVGRELASTDALRQEEIHSKLITVGQQDKDYFIEIAAALGWTITITEYKPFICGEDVSGDPCGNFFNYFRWLVTVDYIRNKDVTTLKDTILRLKPAHTLVDFDWGGVGFDRGFSDGFSSIPKDNLEGGFSKGFNLGFEVRHGGGFDASAFSNGFDIPI